MMPGFTLWQDAQTALAAENEALRRWRDAEQRHPRRRQRRRGRGRWLIALLVALLAIGATVEHRSTSHPTALNATTPVAALPWRLVEAPSGAFRVELPAKATARTSASTAGTGQELHAVIPAVTVSVAAYTVTGRPNDSAALVGSLITERADRLNGYPETVRTAPSRVGQAFEAVVTTAAAIAVVRVIVDGSTLYVIEVQGDVDSARTQQIYDHIVLSFTPTNTH